MKRSSLLIIDGILNLALGALLIVFPDRLVSALGVPETAPAFYPNILGGVLFGIYDGSDRILIGGAGDF